MKMKVKFLSLTVAAVAAAALLSGCSQTAPQADATDPVSVVCDIATTQYFTQDAVSQTDIETILLAGINAPSAMNGQPWHFSVVTDAAVLEQIAAGMSFGGGKPGDKMPGGIKGGQVPEGFTFPEDGQMPEGFTFPEDGQMPEDFAFPEDGKKPEDMMPPKGDKMMMPSGLGGGMTKAGLTDAPLAIVISCKAGSELDAGLACQNMSVAAQLLGYGSKIISSPTIALNGEKQAEYRQLLGIPEDQSAAAILLIGKEDVSVDETMDGYSGATERAPLDDVVTFVR